MRSDGGNTHAADRGDAPGSRALDPDSIVNWYCGLQFGRPFGGVHTDRVTLPTKPDVAQKQLRAKEAGTAQTAHHGRGAPPAVCGVEMRLCRGHGRAGCSAGGQWAQCTCMPQITKSFRNRENTLTEDSRGCMPNLWNQYSIPA